MEIEHNILVYLSKSAGLLYLFVLFAIAVIYACWPSKKQTFDAAARQILDDEDKPCR